MTRRTPAKAPDNQKLETFKITAGKSIIPLHLASGDFVKVRNIDVLVNSENDYMQMPQAFEGRTVSSMLRRRGASASGGRYQDIQQEFEVAQLRDRLRPVQFAEVFATSAGGPDSELARINKAKYVFHVAAVPIPRE